MVASNDIDVERKEYYQDTLLPLQPTANSPQSTEYSGKRKIRRKPKTNTPPTSSSSC